MYRKPIYLLFSILVILTMILSACASTEETEAVPGEAETGQADTGESGAAPQTGGTVVLILPEEPATLNAYMSDAAMTYQIAGAISMTSLVVVNENGEFVPTLAAELPSQANGGVSQDFLTITWRLRPGLKWSDGEPLTSDDIKFTWEAISNPASGALLTYGFDLITGIDTPDDLTAVIHYSQPYLGYLGQFNYGLYPRHATGTPETMPNWEWNRNPVAAGPFIVSDWIAGDSITMVRNPYYYEEGKPYLDSLIFKVVPEPAAQTALMLSGEAQVHLWPGEAQVEYNNIMGGVAQSVIVPGIWNMAIDFNLSMPFDDNPGPTPPHPILGDIRVRQAIAHALDYDTLTTGLNIDVSPSTSPFAYGWYNCDLPRLYGYDPERARQLLEEAGWVLGDDGIRVSQGVPGLEDGTRLSLELQGYTSFEPLQRTEEFIVENLAAVGVEARIQNYDFSIIFGSYTDGSPRKLGDFDMLIYDRGTGVEPHDYIYNHFASDQIPSQDNPDGGNIYRWTNTEADEYLNTAGSTFDIEARRAAYCELGQLIMEELPGIYIYLFVDGYGFSSRLHGYTVSTWGNMVWDVQNWTIDP